MINIDLRHLAAGLGVITPAFGAFMAEAAGVALEVQGHTPKAKLDLRGLRATAVICAWTQCTPNAFLTFNDLDIATNFGAEAIAVLLVSQLLQLQIVNRSVKGTGFDYWLGNDPKRPFDYLARLEVSGIANGEDSTIRAPVKKKLAQTDASDWTNLNAFVAIIEFSRPRCDFVKK